jgi:hypothetical protein
MDCGGCKHFQKWKNDKYGGGVCLLYDIRTKTDNGQECKYFNAIPYNRKITKKHFKLILKEELTESAHNKNQVKVYKKSCDG